MERKIVGTNRRRVKKSGLYQCHFIAHIKGTIIILSPKF